MKSFKIPILLILFVLGIVILAWPDDNDRLFSLSAAHGPSRLDMLGMIMIFVPYAILISMAWKSRARLAVYQPIKMNLGIFLAGIGLGLILASVMNDYPHWWVFGAALLFMVQVPLFYVTLSKG